mmetsp:Transcript_6615/g.9832  ORF Transcript_6615/g.9832 Transcript_6615/m.9832 type:complete len:388 (+) Transcript_6615:127-1290(+)
MSEADITRRTEERTPGGMKNHLWVQRMKVDLAKAKSEKSEALRVAREIQLKLQASKRREVELQGKVKYKEQECQALGLRLQAVEATLRSEREAVRPEREALVTLADQATEEAKLVKMEKEDLFDELGSLRKENSLLKTKLIELEAKLEKKASKRSFRRTLTGTPTARSNSFAESKSMTPGPVSPLAAPGSQRDFSRSVSTPSTQQSTTPKNTSSAGRPRLQRSERSAVITVDPAIFTNDKQSSPDTGNPHESNISTTTNDDRRTEPTNEEVGSSSHKKERRPSNSSERSNYSITDDEPQATPPTQLPPVVSVPDSQDEGAPTVAAPLSGYDDKEPHDRITPYSDCEDPRLLPSHDLQREISLVQAHGTTPVLEVVNSQTSFDFSKKN